MKKKRYIIIAAALSIALLEGCGGRISVKESTGKETSPQITSWEAESPEKTETKSMQEIEDPEETETESLQEIEDPEETETESLQEIEDPEETETESLQEIEDPEEIEKILADSEQIEAMNQRTIKNPNSHTMDLNQSFVITAQEVKDDIEAYQIPDKVYFGDHEKTLEDDQMLAALTNIEEITDPVTVQYGIIASNSAVRSFPTMERIADGNREIDFDYLQESMLTVGEGAVIVHQTRDQIWSFIISSNYKGWIQTNTIAVCSQSEMIEYLKKEKSGVVIAAKTEIGGQMLRMGTRLFVETFDGATAVIWMPKRLKDGSISYEKIAYTDLTNFSVGYLPYTRDNILAQAGKLVGMPYGWGDTNENMDCSSTVNSIFRCFGFLLPRNTSALPEAGGRVIDLSAFSAEEKREVIHQYKAGTLLVMKGHVVMYMGKKENTDTIFHNVTKISYDGVNSESVLKALNTSMECFKEEENYLDLYRYLVVLQE